MPTTRQPSSRRHERASAPERRPADPRPPAPCPSSGACAGVHEHAPGARPRSRAAANSPPSTCSPGEPHEQVAGPQVAGVHHHPRGPGRRPDRRRRAWRRRPRPCARRRRSITRASPARERSASRATVTSSNGSLRPSSNSWPCSWPLPATTITSPGPAASTASAIARRRSTSRSASAPAPAITSSMIASGSSLRGLSEVTITRSARRRAASPISGRLARSRSPPAPNTATSRPAGELARRAQHVLERVGGVGVVHEHAEVLALVHRLEAAGHALEPGQRRGDRVERDARATRTAATAASTFCTLNTPGSGERSSTAPSGVSQREGRAGEVEAHVARPVVRVALDREGHGSRARAASLRPQGSSTFTIDVPGPSNSRRLAAK